MNHIVVVLLEHHRSQTLLLTPQTMQRLSKQTHIALQRLHLIVMSKLSNHLPTQVLLQQIRRNTLDVVQKDLI